MSKFLTILLAGLFLFAAAVPAMATDARQAALANTGNFIEDDYNIFTWYATLPSYSNMLWVGMQDLDRFHGDDMFYYMGASYGLGEEGKFGTLAAFFYSEDFGLNPFAPSGAWEGQGLFGDPLPNKFTLMYAYPMEKLSIGLYFNRSDSYVKEEQDVVPPATTVELSQAHTTFGVGLRFDIGEKLYADIAADLAMANYKYEATVGTATGSVEDDAHSMYGIRARAFYEWNETITWVPYFNFSTFDFSLKSENIAIVNFGDKGTILDFGLGANIKVNEDNLLIFAVEPYGMQKREPSEPPAQTSAEQKITYLPRFWLALESDVKDWLTFRVGAQKNLVKAEQKAEQTGVGKIDMIGTGQTFGFFMGLGFHVSDFDIDLLVNNNLPFHLGYWLTGYQPEDEFNEWPIYMISTTYGF